MQALTDTLSDAASQARSWLGVSKAYMYQGDYRAALDSAAKAEDIAQAANARSEFALALWMKGWGSFRLGDMGTALPISEQVLALSTELNNQGQMALTLSLLGVVHYAVGHYEQSEHYFEQARKLSEEIGDSYRAMTITN